MKNCLKYVLNLYTSLYTLSNYQFTIYSLQSLYFNNTFTANNIHIPHNFAVFIISSLRRFNLLIKHVDQSIRLLIVATRTIFLAIFHPPPPFISTLRTEEPEGNWRIIETSQSPLPFCSIVRRNYRTLVE